LSCFVNKRYEDIEGCDAIEYYLGKIKDVQQNIDEYQKHLQYLRSKAFSSDRGIGIAFITFRTITYAKRCVHDFATSEPPLPVSLRKPRLLDEDGSRRRAYDQLDMSRWKVVKAPHPDDILWKSLLIPRWSFWIRVFLINSIFFVFLFFFTTPSAILGGLEDIIKIKFGSSEDSFVHSNWFEDTITGLLPTLILVFLAYLIPLILESKFLIFFF
jgi:hypothetical protein